MKMLFWISFGITLYSYIGYPIVLWLLAHMHYQPVRRYAIKPSVSIVIAVRNEELNLSAKLENLWQVDYPRNQLQVVIASDGSTDRTAEILREYDTAITSIILDKSVGKAATLNQAVQMATGEILVFLDRDSWSIHMQCLNLFLLRRSECRRR